MFLFHQKSKLRLTEYTFSRDVLPYAISALQGAGYQLVTLAECLGRVPYLDVGEATPKDVGG